MRCARSSTLKLRRSIVDLGMVRSIEIGESGKVEVVVSPTTLAA